MVDDSRGKLRTVPVCKFVPLEDAQPENDVLRREPASLEDWKASVRRCMQVVESRMDDIEHRILNGGAGRGK